MAYRDLPSIQNTKDKAQNGGQICSLEEAESNLVFV
jgi:hypothetical protein